MKITRTIVILAMLIGFFSPNSRGGEPRSFSFDFYGDAISFSFDPGAIPNVSEAISPALINSFYQSMQQSGYERVVEPLIAYKEKVNPDDWLFYQLIRKTAQQLSPKDAHYKQYTLYKWFLLSKSGYDATLAIGNDRLLFYVQCDENIYNIPYRKRDGKQFVCLNYHDYGEIDFDKEQFTEAYIPIATHAKPFSYKITHLPGFDEGDYTEKDLSFNYYQTDYHFKVKINPQVKNIFANYPVVDYASYFNIPLSRETYNSLISVLRKNIRGMSKRNGVDYLMRFTRYAFPFERDTDAFGKEKRLSPEETLVYGQSDCEDRSALFFYLVKEIYDLPMIVLAYPKHVTIAVKFDKPIGHPIVYNGSKYSICEPTPQQEDLQLGEVIPGLRKESYEVVYAYQPPSK